MMMTCMMMMLSVWVALGAEMVCSSESLRHVRVCRSSGVLWYLGLFTYMHMCITPEYVTPTGLQMVLAMLESQWYVLHSAFGSMRHVWVAAFLTVCSRLHRQEQEVV
jgi:hypothetical protein